MPKVEKAIKHHNAAAKHHAQAAHHHHEAAKHYKSGAHEKAAHHAHVAHGHGCTRGDMPKAPARRTPKSTTRVSRGMNG